MMSLYDKMCEKYLFNPGLLTFIVQKWPQGTFKICFVTNKNT